MARRGGGGGRGRAWGRGREFFFVGLGERLGCAAAAATRAARGGSALSVPGPTGLPTLLARPPRSANSLGMVLTTSPTWRRSVGVGVRGWGLRREQEKRGLGVRRRNGGAPPFALIPTLTEDGRLARIVQAQHQDAGLPVPKQGEQAGHPKAHGGDERGLREGRVGFVCVSLSPCCRVHVYCLSLTGWLGGVGERDRRVPGSARAADGTPRRERGVCDAGGRFLFLELVHNPSFFFRGVVLSILPSAPRPHPLRHSAMADKAGSALSRFLAKLPFKSPWKVRVRCARGTGGRRPPDGRRRRRAAVDRAPPPSPLRGFASPSRAHSHSRPALLYRSPASRLPLNSRPTCPSRPSTASTRPRKFSPFFPLRLGCGDRPGPRGWGGAVRRPARQARGEAGWQPHPLTAATKKRGHARAHARAPAHLSRSPHPNLAHPPPLSLSSSAPTRPSVPHARPDRVYDIKYWVRDTRRAGQLVGGTNRLHMETTAVDVTAADPALDAAGPAVPGKPYTFTARSPLLDAPNNGYTT